MNYRVTIYTIVYLAAAFVIQGCFIPWIGNKDSKSESISVFDKKAFLEVREYDFPEYKWNSNAKFAEEMYAKVMADYFFTNQYQKALELFESAWKVCPKDARIYVRMIECFARMEEYQKALDTIQEADKELRGFSYLEGITAYKKQLSQRLEDQKLSDDHPERPLWKKILFAPAKLWPF